MSIGYKEETPKSESTLCSHLSSEVSAAMKRYSASAQERDTVCCFLIFQDIEEKSRKTIHLVSDRQVRGQLA